MPYDYGDTLVSMRCTNMDFISGILIGEYEMSLIFVFNIDNRIEDYAKAFQFVDRKECNDKNWQNKHVSMLSTNSLFTRIKPNMYEDDRYKKIISYVEQGYATVAEVNLPPEIVAARERYFYFRVKLTADDDVTTLHHYLLARSYFHREHCFMALIKQDLSDNDVFRVSHYLAYEYFRDEKHSPSAMLEVSKKGARPYRMRLLPSDGWRDNVFLLKRDASGGHYYPSSLNKVSLSASHTFFSPVYLNLHNYYTLCQSVDVVFGRHPFDNKYESGHISSDLISAMAYDYQDFSGYSEKDLKGFVEDGRMFPLDRSRFLTVSLREFCSTCRDTLQEYSRKATVPDDIKARLKCALTFCEDNTHRLSVLACCIYLSFICFLVDSNIKNPTAAFNLDIDALIMDAEDYADSLLQIIENAVLHSEGGFFCFRIHRGKSQGNTSAYLRKYNLNGECDYYLEFMVSDINQTMDIPQKFYDNIASKPSEYEVNQTDLAQMKSTFSLKHFFNYSYDKTNLWQKFYDNAKNITSHYGLLVFDNLVGFAEGGFRVVSCSDYKASPDHQYSNREQPTTDVWHLPGTQYEILLPIMFFHKPFATGLNTQLDTATIAIKHNQQNISPQALAQLQDAAFPKEIEKVFAENGDGFTEYKKTIVHTLIRQIKEKIETSPNEHTIVCYDVFGINHTLAAEIFAKTFITSLYNFDMKIKYFAILNASDTMLAAFIRIFSLLYMKAGKAVVMKNRQVFICSQNAEKEYLFYDISIKKSVAASYSLASVKGMYERELGMLSRTAEKCREGTQRADLKLFPFDILLNNLFENKVTADLQRSLQMMPFGCCLEEVHMRVGTKIHVHGNYYEASLLFGLSNYISRFAYIIASKAIERIEAEKAKRVVFIGYESYSESMMINIKEAVEYFYATESSSIDVDYIIYYEQSREEPFARWSKVEPDADTRFIIVVPIGSTLTTHDKIVADLCRQKKAADGSHGGVFVDSILAHYALTLIRNNNKKNPSPTGCRPIETDFWESIDTKAKYIKYSKSEIGAGNRIDLFAVVESEWLLPNECKYCYPDYSKDICMLGNEVPLIQSNRASVVPMTMIGLKDTPAGNIEKLPTISQTYEDLQPLYAGLCYGHVVRNGGNHYMYYFQTDKVMEAILESETQKDKFTAWLLNIRAKFFNNEKTKGRLSYHFIVAPLHKTNARFVQQINKVVFQNAQQVIWLDTKREYRDNVRTKHSNITALYNNLISIGKEADIHFHYVDDTITSGFNINRAKSTTLSLFPKGTENVHLFSSVILLLNRNSTSTMHSYIDEDCFHSYIQLNISSMRNHHDACVPCKNYINYTTKLIQGSATNILAQNVVQKSKKYELRPSSAIITPMGMLPLLDQDTINKKYYDPHSDYASLSKEAKAKLVDEEITEVRTRYYNRMVADHRFKTIFDCMGGKQNDVSKVKQGIWEELSGICSDYRADNPKSYQQVYERLFSAIKVISRPFLSFRQSVLHSATSVLLEITLHFLWQQCNIDENIQRFIKAIKAGDKKTHQRFLKLLLSCLISLNSTIIVRAVTINTFFEYCRHNDLDIDELSVHYILCIKRLLYLSGKDSLSVWIEYLLSERQEMYPVANADIVKINENDSDIMKFIQSLRLENTLPIRDALQECFRIVQQEGVDVNRKDDIELVKLVDQALKQYYNKAYVDFANGFGIEDVIKQFVPMMKLYIHLSALHKHDRGEDIFPTASGLNRKEAKYYRDLLEIVKVILTADKLALFIGIDAGPNGNGNGNWNGNGNSKTLSWLYPNEKPGRANQQVVYMEKFANEIYNNNLEDVKNIGNTLYWKNSQTCCMGVLKFVNDGSIQHDDPSLCWYLAFEIPDINQDNDLITRARNLLSMRHEILKKLTDDFDNNIISSFLTTKSQLVSLSTDKSGSHTPFGELLAAFKDIIDYKIDGNNVNKDAEKNEKMLVGNQMKLIADSMISKLYILSILEEPIEDTPVNGKVHFQRGEKLQEWWNKVEKCTLSSNIEGDTRVPNLNCDIKWGELKVDHPYKCEVIWYSSVIAILMNALRHGRCQSKSGHLECNIEITLSDDKNHIVFKNFMVDGKTYSTKKPVTLKALKYYFDKYYGKGEFKAESLGDEFVVTLPCKINKGNSNESIVHRE